MGEDRLEFKFPRILVGFTIAIILLLLLEAVWLGARVLDRLEDLSIAQTDNRQWNLTQIEVEHLKVENAALAVQSLEDLPSLRRVFDVFYSRIITVRESRVFAPLRENETALRHLHDIQSQIDEMATYIDSTDAELFAQLPLLNSLLQDNRESIRRFALTGLEVYSTLNESNRVGLHALLSQLAAVVFVLITALIATVCLLAGLYRRGQAMAIEKIEVASKLQAMVSSSLDAVLVVGHDGRIQDYNGAAETVFGYSREEAINAEFLQLMVPKHLQRVYAAGFDHCVKHGTSSLTDRGRIELEACRKNGEMFPVELSISAAKSGVDAVFVSYLRDISDRYAVEEELRRARDNALAGERAKAALLTVMSHEMRTPLTGILGAVDVLEDTPLTDGQKRYIDAMRISGELLLHHVNDILELSRLEAGASVESVSAFDMEGLVTALVGSQQASAQRAGLDLSVHCYLGETSHVLGQSRALQQILLNLVGNAIKFTEEGAVMVDVCRIDDTDQVEIQVADTGKGIPADHLEQIFDDFVRVDASYGRVSEGTGLGLAITKRLVQGMGGYVSCESELGEGSTFVVSVNLPPAEATNETNARSAAIPTQHARLLIVEDNDINRELLLERLQKMGHNVTAASGGAEAVEAVRQSTFDLVLMDISMPEVDGIEAITRIRDQNLAPDTDIVALTAYVGADDHEHILEAGFVEVLTKPIDKPALEDVIFRRAGGLSQESEGTAGSDIAQYFTALGPERARVFLVEFQEDVVRFSRTLQSALSNEVRAEAHRLAGSAAVLGLGELREVLLSIEMADAGVDPGYAHFASIWEQANEHLQEYL
ncbi:hybrid sensor histidine kinase/response regulator [Epibacterium ulvae]|uniref:hybrid sensor histidine kinase/response regulator n=1 Tax=Epibacterium ulvae TaxID=1156985 RepID=UPI002491F995|nr:ATP-binding protein [Epibacterium ulvae]